MRRRGDMDISSAIRDVVPVDGEAMPRWRTDRRVGDMLRTGDMRRRGDMDISSAIRDEVLMGVGARLRVCTIGIHEKDIISETPIRREKFPQISCCPRHMNAAATVIWILHALFLAFVIATPFTSNESLLLFHAIAVPLLWIHWLANDSSCVLTVLEANARGVDAGETFMQRLVGPVYSLEGGHAATIAWIGSATLWCVSAAKVCGRPGGAWGVFQRVFELSSPSPLGF